MILCFQRHSWFDLSEASYSLSQKVPLWFKQLQSSYSFLQNHLLMQFSMWYSCSPGAAAGKLLLLVGFSTASAKLIPQLFLQGLYTALLSYTCYCLDFYLPYLLWKSPLESKAQGSWGHDWCGGYFWEERADCFGLSCSCKGFSPWSSLCLILYPVAAAQSFTVQIWVFFYFPTTIHGWYGAMVEKLVFWCGISEVKLQGSLRKEKIISAWLKKNILKQVMKNTASFRNALRQNIFLMVGHKSDLDWWTFCERSINSSS